MLTEVIAANLYGKIIQCLNNFHYSNETFTTSSDNEPVVANWWVSWMQAHQVSIMVLFPTLRLPLCGYIRKSVNFIAIYTYDEAKVRL